MAGELDVAKCVVVLWSGASVKSDWVLDEANEGKARGLLVQATIEDVRAPFGFRQYQTANLVGWNGNPEDPSLDDLFTGVVDRIPARPEQSPSPGPTIARSAEDASAGSAAPHARERAAPFTISRAVVVGTFAALAVLLVAFLLTSQLRTGGEPPHSQDVQRVAPLDQQSSPQAARTPDVSPLAREAGYSGRSP